MDNTQLNRLLNTACEIIMSLEHHADTYTTNKIEVLFQEIKYSDNLDADMEAQDWETFKENKI